MYGKGMVAYGDRFGQFKSVIDITDHSDRRKIATHYE